MAKRSKKLSQWLIMFPVAALIAAVGYWNLDSGQSAQQLSSLDPERTIDFFATNTRTSEFNQDGQLQYILDSEYVEHIQQSDISLLTDPRLQLYRGQELPWLISGKLGELSAGGELLDLQENVIIEHLDAPQRPFVLTTEQMYYVFANDHAHTTHDVQINSQQGITTATGMHAYLTEGLVHLLAKVRGRYELQ